MLHRWAASPIAAPLALLGRQSLPVFALGTVLAIAIQTVKTVTGQNLLLDSLMIGGGLLLQLALAAAKQYWPDEMRRPTRKGGAAGVRPLPAGQGPHPAEPIRLDQRKRVSG